MALLDFLKDIPIIGDVLGGAEDYRRSKRLQEREHGLALEYAPKYFDEQQRQASETWLGEGAIGPDVTRAQTEANIGGRLDAAMSRGATLPEALGTGGGSNPAGPTAMLGNGPQQAQGRAMMANHRFAMTMQQNELATRMKIAEMQYGEGSPSERGAGVQERTVAIKEALLDAERDYKTNLAAKTLNEVATSHVTFVMDKIVASMGPENIRATLLAKAAEADGVSIFRGTGHIDRATLIKWISALRSEGSTFLREATGIENWAEMQFDRFLETILQRYDSLTTSPDMNKDWKEYNASQ